MGANGLLLRTHGIVRQACPLGQKQVAGNPTNATVPASQCGPPSGFELSADGVGWHAVTALRQSPTGRHALLLSLPPALREYAARAAADARNGPAGERAGGKKLRLRYLWADWPTPTVYSNVSYLGVNGELPAPPFEMDVLL